MWLVAVAAAIFGKADRQFPVAGDALLEDLDVRRTIHRLQREQLGLARDDRLAFLGRGHFVGHDEHVLAELAPMAGLDPESRIDELRGFDLAVARGVEPAPQIGFQLAPDHPALRMPEDRPRRFRLEVEQVHLLPDLAMVALGRFLEPPVDPAQHRVLGIAAPISARHARQLERIGVELAGRGEMRPAAEVDPRLLALAGAVHGDGLARGQLHHPLGFEGLTRFFEEVADLVARPDLTHQRLVGGDDAPHLLLDRGQVLLGEGAVRRGRREVVIEAVLGRGAEGDLRSGKDVLHRLGEDVRIVVPHQLERFGLVAGGDEREARVALERARDVPDLAIHFRGQRSLGEAGPDRRGNVGRGRALRHFPHRSVGKHNLEHFGHVRGHVARRDRPLNRSAATHLPSTCFHCSLHPARGMGVSTWML